MFSKKLLTLACVVGILICGGCIFIPSGSGPSTPPPPPPALRPELLGVRTIAVTVTNTSESQHLAPSALAQQVAEQINRLTYQYSIRSPVKNDAGVADAVLAIEVLSESATPPNTSSPHSPWWSFRVKTSATLTRKDGQVIWRETYDDHDLTCDLRKKDAADPWKAATLRSNWPQAGVADHVVDHMLHVKANDNP